MTGEEVRFVNIFLKMGLRRATGFVTSLVSPDAWLPLWWARGLTADTEDAMEFLKRRSEEIYALTRIVVGFLFLCHGLDKLDFLLTGSSFAGNAAGYAQMPLPLGWAATLIETLTGAAVMLGFSAGVAGFLASGMMAVAYFMAHQKGGLLPIQNHGELAALYSWAFLLIASRGSGIWSVDKARGAG